MAVILQIDFPYHGPFGEGMREVMADLALSIAGESGLIWKIWTENEVTQEAGGIYLFDSEEAANAYLKMHSERLGAVGVQGIKAKIFQVNQELSLLSKARQDFLT